MEAYLYSVLNTEYRVPPLAPVIPSSTLFTRRSKGRILGFPRRPWHICVEMPLRLISPDGTKTYDLRDGVPLIVGRAPTCDLPVFHPTISRRHAELMSDGTGLSLRDLGSSNGTYLNGAKIEKGRASIDDLLAFGKVGFRLEAFGSSTPATSHAGVERAMIGATIVRQIPM